MAKVKINPTFRLDVDGKLFRNKSSNNDIQETLFFNALMSRLSIVKGDLPTFPNLGLKQWLGRFAFNTESEITTNVAGFEEDIENQLGKNCTIEYELDPDNKFVKISIDIEGFSTTFNMEYNNANGSIRVIEPQLTD